ASKRSASLKFASRRGLEAIWMAATIVMLSSTGFETEFKAIGRLATGGKRQFLGRQAKRNQPVTQFFSPKCTGLPARVHQREPHGPFATRGLPCTNGFRDGNHGNQRLRRAGTRPFFRAQ